MCTRHFTLSFLSVMVILLTGCSSTKQVSSVEPIDGHPFDDVLLDDVTVKMQRTQKDFNENVFVNEMHVPSNVIKLNTGPSLVCSDVQTPSRYYKYKLGLDYGIEYQHFWHTGWGVGANLYLFNSSFDKDLNMEMKYMGPTVAYSDYLDSNGKVRADIEFGLGCGILKEKGFYNTNTETDFAAMLGVGVECAVAKNVAFGFQLNWNTLYMSKPKGYYIKDEDRYGIERCSLLFGVRLYF